MGGSPPPSVTPLASSSFKVGAVLKVDMRDLYNKNIKMIPWKTTQKQALVPQNSTYSILRTFSSPLDIMG